MEIESVRAIPHVDCDCFAPKRRRIFSDSPPPPKVRITAISEEKVALLSSNESSGITDDTARRYSSRHASHQNDPSPSRIDDEEGHYVYKLGERLTSRYQIHKKMGKGTFGQVLECWDEKNNEMVAVKIIRATKQYREDAKIEIEMLEKLNRHKRKHNHCVKIRNWFDYRNHICIVFEKLGPSLFEFLRSNEYRSFPLNLVREIGKQLLECVAYMHGLNLIHTDLKPENVLLVSSEYSTVFDRKGEKRVPKSSDIKVIDFGSTTYDEYNQSYVVSTRHYRAPEVILGIGWSYPCDLWSVGCILVELCTGDTLFETREDLEHLAMMERVIGEIPYSMMKKAKGEFVRHGRLDWPRGASSSESVEFVKEIPRLKTMVRDHVDDGSGDFYDLLGKLLRHDPYYRLTASEALRHRFFTRT